MIASDTCRPNSVRSFETKATAIDTNTGERRKKIAFEASKVGASGGTGFGVLIGRPSS